MSNSLYLSCASMGGHQEAVTSWLDTASKPWYVNVDETLEGEDAGFLVKCDKAWRGADATIIGYLHSDLYILEKDWDVRVLAAFDDPRVAVVGFVGATGLAHADIYKVRYDFRQLARNGVFSNLTDWEVHGEQETGSRPVAVVDSCAVFTRREFLTRIGGWPTKQYPNSSHCSDLWLCCMAHRCGLRNTLVGVRATHTGGGKGAVGSEWLSRRHGDDQGFHKPAHALIYQDFRDILPLRVVK